MNEVPLDPPGALCGSNRQNASLACDNCGAAALSFGYDFPL
jgi:hypothetical protein